MHLILSSGNQISEKRRSDLKQIMKGLCKSVVKEIREKGLSTTEGKEHMTFVCYKKICQLFIDDGQPESMFALCFLTMQWNLTCRSETTENIAFNQMSWENDHMKIFFPKHKSDQIGLNKDEPRHVYSNP